MQRYFNASPPSGRRDNNVKNVETSAGVSSLCSHPKIICRRTLLESCKIVKASMGEILL